MKLVMALLTLIPLAVMADGRPQFGVSGKVVDTEQEHQVGAATQRALEQQRRSPPAEKASSPCRSTSTRSAAWRTALNSRSRKLLVSRLVARTEMNRQRGALLFITPIIMIAVILLGVLALDGARLYSLRQEMQSQVNAAATAAADGTQTCGGQLSAWKISVHARWLLHAPKASVVRMTS